VDGTGGLKEALGDLKGMVSLRVGFEQRTSEGHHFGIRIGLCMCLMNLYLGIATESALGTSGLQNYVGSFNDWFNLVASTLICCLKPIYVPDNLLCFRSRTKFQLPTAKPQAANYPGYNYAALSQELTSLWQVQTAAKYSQGLDKGVLQAQQLLIRV
jgi:hypothetical protein